jgi:hypothetical protein
MVSWVDIRYMYGYEGALGTISYVEKDSLQAFSSSIAGLLSSRAVLQGLSGLQLIVIKESLTSIQASVSAMPQPRLQLPFFSRSYKRAWAE